LTWSNESLTAARVRGHSTRAPISGAATHWLLWL